MSDAIEKLQQELQEAKHARAESEARVVRLKAEQQAVDRQLDSMYRAIERAHREWMAALDAVDDPIFLHDSEFRVLRCNRAYQQSAGLPFKQIIGCPYYDIFPKTGAPLRQCRHGLEGEEDEIRVGSLTYRSRGNCVQDEQGKYLYSLHVLEDITDQKRSHDLLIASRDLLKDIVENTPVRVFWKDIHSRYLGCNTAFARDAGLSRPEDLVGRDDFQMAWRAQADLYRAADQRVMDSNAPELGYEEPQTTPDGRTIWLRTSKVPLHDDAGQVIGILGIYEDVTERRLAAAKLTESERKYRELVQDANSIILRWARNGHITFMNEFGQQFFGYTEAELLDRHVVGTIVPETESGGRDLKDLMDRICADPKQFEQNVNENMRRSGERVWINWTNRIIFDERQEVKEILSIGIDITARKQAEESLKRANRALRTLSAGTEALMKATEETRLLNDMVRIIVEVGGYRMAWVGYAQNDPAKTVRAMAHFGANENYLDEVHIDWADDEHGRGPTGTAIRTGKTQVNRDFQTTDAVTPWRERARKAGFVSSIALPLSGEGLMLGALTIYADEVAAFDEDEVKLLEELAGALAYGITTLRTRADRSVALEKLRKSLEDSIQAIAAMVEMRDPYTAGHQQRVGELAAAIARDMGLDEHRVHGLHLAGIVHDIGKLRVPAEILSKPGRLTEVESNLVRMHVQTGYDILKNVDFPWPIAQMVLQHHERLDGSGYPQGLKGAEILLESKILSVADVVEAMSSHRPYRPALGVDAALKEIERHRGVQYDPIAVDTCVQLLREGRYKLPA